MTKTKICRYSATHAHAQLLEYHCTAARVTSLAYRHMVWRGDFAAVAGDLSTTRHRVQASGATTSSFRSYDTTDYICTCPPPPPLALLQTPISGEFHVYPQVGPMGPCTFRLRGVYRHVWHDIRVLKLKTTSQHSSNIRGNWGRATMVSTS